MRGQRFYTLSPKTNRRIPKILVQRVNVEKELKRLRRQTFKNRNGFELEIKRTWKCPTNADPAQILKEVFAPHKPPTEETNINNKENNFESLSQEPADELPLAYEYTMAAEEQKVNPLTGFPESFDVGVFEPETSSTYSGTSSQALLTADYIRCSYCEKMDTKQKIWQHTIMEHSNSSSGTKK